MPHEGIERRKLEIRGNEHVAAAYAPVAAAQRGEGNAGGRGRKIESGGGRVSDVAYGKIEMTGQKSGEPRSGADAGYGQMSLALDSRDAAGAVLDADAHARDAGRQFGQRKGSCGLRMFLRFFLVEDFLDERAGNVERGAFQRDRTDDGLESEQGKIAYLYFRPAHVQFHVVHAAAQQGEVRGMNGGNGQDGKRHLPDAALHVEFRLQKLRHGGRQTRRLKPREIAVNRQGEKNSPQQQKYGSRTGFAHIPS